LEAGKQRCKRPGTRLFHEGLDDHGWVPGRNLLIEYRFADDERDKLAALVQDLVRLKLDAIFVPTRPALPTVRDATSTIPIVFVSLGDPVAEGWVASLAKPRRNLTGVAGEARKGPLNPGKV
jgi:ABC-type uncharacterized transport system substrate-binding protein